LTELSRIADALTRLEDRQADIYSVLEGIRVAVDKNARAMEGMLAFSTTADDLYEEADACQCVCHSTDINYKHGDKLCCPFANEVFAPEEE
jgi:hypothetical protein